MKEAVEQRIVRVSSGGGGGGDGSSMSSVPDLLQVSEYFWSICNFYPPPKGNCFNAQCNSMFPISTLCAPHTCPPSCEDQR
jgi:hypothetical protein